MGVRSANVTSVSVVPAKKKTGRVSAQWKHQEAALHNYFCPNLVYSLYEHEQPGDPLLLRCLLSCDPNTAADCYVHCRKQ